MVTGLRRSSPSLKCCTYVRMAVFSRLLFRALDRWGRGTGRTGCRCYSEKARLSQPESRWPPHTAQPQGARRRPETRWRYAPQYWTDSPNSTPPGSYYSSHLLENSQFRKLLVTPELSNKYCLFFYCLFVC